jgi:hypothetical protein
MSRRDDELAAFVRRGLAQGIARADLRAALLQAGWQPAQADAALAAYADSAFPIPVPAPRQTVSAGEAFLYLVQFTTLYLAAWHLGSLLFSFVERAFPDPLVGAFGTDRSIRLAIAFLIVALPTFLFTAGRVRRMLAAEPARRGSPTRKWLTWIALFVAVVFLVGDLVTLVYWALGGELTVRFLLKVAIVATIAGSIFGYYLADLRRDDRPA